MSTSVTILISGSQKIISRGQLLCGQTGTSQECGSTSPRNLENRILSCMVFLQIPHISSNHLMWQCLALSKKYGRNMLENGRKHDSFLIINTFVSCVVPMYYANVTRQTVVSGFRATGLHPFDSSAPDYTKIRTAETYIPNIAIFEEIDQGRLALV